MAINVTQLVSEVNKGVDEEVGKYLQEVQRNVRLAYEEIVLHPVQITAYYRSNHSIVIRDSLNRFKTQGARLSPGTKESEERDFYLANFDPRVEEELSKIPLIGLGDKAEISTIVPYADSVEQNHNVYGAVTRFGFEKK